MFSWFSFLTYAVVTAVTPGPNTLMSMSNGGRLGFRRALPFNLGIWVGFTVVILLCTALCDALSALIPRIKFPMLVLGAAYMLHLAWQTWRSAPLSETHAARDGFWSGLLLQFVNPKIYIYCIVSMEAYILPFYQGAPCRWRASRCCWPSSASPSPCCGPPSAPCSGCCSLATPGSPTR